MHDLPVYFKVKTEFIAGEFDDLENKIEEYKKQYLCWVLVGIKLV